MRVVFFAREGFQQDPLFTYIFAHVASAFGDSRIVFVQPPAPTVRKQVASRWRKMKRMGFGQSLGILSSLPLAHVINHRDGRRIGLLLEQLPRPPLRPDVGGAIRVASVNGDDAVQALKAMEPDVILQAGAGILKKQVIGIARIGTVNMHHGIAPLIKGMNSIRWALLERRPEWIGTTVHLIDEGIDTGDALAYAPVAQERSGEGFSELFVRATQAGVSQMLEVLARLQAGERWRLDAPPGEHVYRSTISGWKLLALEWMRWRSKLGAVRPNRARVKGAPDASSGN